MIPQEAVEADNKVLASYGPVCNFPDSPEYLESVDKLDGVRSRAGRRRPYREVAEKAWDEWFMRANRLVNCRMCRGTTVPKINPYTV